MPTFFAVTRKFGAVVRYFNVSFLDGASPNQRV